MPTGPQTAWITYDQLGRRSWLGQGYTTVTSSTSYTYDGVSRLETQSHDLAGTAYDQTLGFGYNRASQIVQRTRTNSGWEYADQVPGTKAYAVNGLNQYLTAGPNSYQYDANGNLRFDGTRTYVYDAENRLVSVTGDVTSTLTYDPLGRFWRFTGPQSGDLRFLYDGDRLTIEEDPTGARQRAYAWGPGVDEPLIWYELAGGTQPRFLHADHQGSIVALADINGNTLAIDKYDEWGVRSDGNWGRFEYTGQAWLADIGLYYYKARMYSSRLGRFLQTDPIGYKDQVNLYAYVGNEPVNGRDPTGLAGCDRSVSGADCATLMQEQKRALADVRATRSAIGRIEKGGKLSAADAAVKSQIGNVFGSTSNSTLNRIDRMFGNVERVLADDGTNFNYHSPAPDEVFLALGGDSSNIAASTHFGSTTINIYPEYFGMPAWHREGTLIHEPTHIFGAIDYAGRIGADSALTHGWQSYLPRNWNKGIENADSYAAMIVGH